MLLRLIVKLVYIFYGTFIKRCIKPFVFWHWSGSKLNLMGMDEMREEKKTRTIR
jgi:hypothetical protein